MSTQVNPKSPYVLPAGEGTPLVWFNDSITRKASCPEMGALEIIRAPAMNPLFTFIRTKMNGSICWKAK